MNTNSMKRNLMMLLAVVAVVAIDFAIGGNGCGATMAFAAVASVAGEAGVGKHTDNILTTKVAEDLSPELNLTDIDKKVVKIKPSATPVDQLMRYMGGKKVQSQIAEYYSADTKPITAAVKGAYKTNTTDPLTIDTTDNKVFSEADEILVRGVKGYQEGGKEVSKTEDLILYVQKKADDGKLVVQAVNGKYVSETYPSVCPDLAGGETLYRLGRMHTELDVQTSPFTSLPTKQNNYCQTFKMQIEESQYEALTAKEVDWNMTDQTENAIYDMKRGMEGSFLFGVKRKIYDSKKQENVLTCGGIWYQAGKEFSVAKTSFTTDSLIAMLKQAFTGNNGSQRRVLLAGSGLTEAIAKLLVDKTTFMRTSAETRWGISWNVIESIYGSLNYMLDEMFDQYGLENCGLIIDPQYLEKKQFIPLGENVLDLVKSGQRNTSAKVLTECACPVLKNPNAHTRVILTV